MTSDPGDSDPEALATEAGHHLHTKIKKFGAFLAWPFNFVLFWYCFFFLFVLATTLPNLNTEPIGDSASFFLMSHDVYTGHLPYFYLWDNKPPGFFLAVGGAMYLFGDTFVVMTLFSAACIFITAIITFSVCCLRSDVAEAGLATAVILSVTGIYFNEVLTEHLVTVLLIATLWLLLTCSERWFSPFLAGVLLSLATLTRTNIGYVVVALGTYYLLEQFPGKRYTHRFALLFYVIGGLFPLLAICFAYLIAGDLQLFIVSAFAVPLRYSSEGISLGDLFVRSLKNWWKGVELDPSVLGTVAWLAIVGWFSFFQRWYEPIAHRRISGGNASFLTLLLWVATTISILKSGKTFEHYWIQIFPFIAVFVAYALSNTHVPRLRTVALFLAVLNITTAVIRFSPAILDDWRNSRGPSQLAEAARLIESDRGNHDKVFALNSSLIYFYLSEMPPSRIIHPSIFRNDVVLSELAKYGYVDAQELKKVLNDRPTYIVVEAGKHYFEGKPQGILLSNTLKDHYSLWRSIGYIQVYKRL